MRPTPRNQAQRRLLLEHMGWRGHVVCSSSLQARPERSARLVEADRRGWKPLADAALPYVTAGLDVRYPRPSPLRDPVELVAVVREASEVAMSVEVTLLWDGKPRAEATALWKRWRPRGATG